jgi:hypothetical protein
MCHKTKSLRTLVPHSRPEGPSLLIRWLKALRDLQPRMCPSQRIVAREGSWYELFSLIAGIVNKNLDDV